MKVVIVHFNPIEKYPPVVNFLRYLSGRKDSPDTTVISTTNRKSSWIGAIAGITRINLSFRQSSNKINRLPGYINFNLRTLLYLIRTRPDVVMYYETLSSWAPVFYKRFIRKSVRLFIHYHEYTSVEEYSSGMQLNKVYHQSEQRIYSSAEWVSHTNEERMQMFIKDINSDIKGKILPNYPPINWWSQSTRVPVSPDQRIGFVYVGALSLQTMHTQEMAEYVAKHPSLCYWDIYSDNHSQDVIEYLKSFGSSNITFKGGVAYDELPSVLPKYDVGVILYKGDTKNYAFNAPNKYFEYLACGLNVLFPKGMKGMLPYEELSGKPWIRSVDFSSIDISVPDYKRSFQIPQPLHYAETVYTELADQIIKGISVNR